MGLDIILCESEDWEKSLRAIELAEEFTEDWAKLNPPWFARYGVDFINMRMGSAMPLDDPVNRQIRRERIVEFCRKRNLRCRFWTRRDNERIYEIDTGIKCWDILLRSSYNENGLNNILRRANLPDCYGIFGLEVDSPFYPFINWEEMGKRAEEVIRRIGNARASSEEVAYVIDSMNKALEMRDIALTNGRERFRVEWLA